MSLPEALSDRRVVLLSLHSSVEGEEGGTGS
jgi:hypothetical protein